MEDEADEEGRGGDLGGDEFRAEGAVHPVADHGEPGAGDAVLRLARLAVGDAADREPLLPLLAAGAHEALHRRLADGDVRGGRGELAEALDEAAVVEGAAGNVSDARHCGVRELGPLALLEHVVSADLSGGLAAAAVGGPSGTSVVGGRRVWPQGRAGGL